MYKRQGNNAAAAAAAADGDGDESVADVGADSSRVQGVQLSQGAVSTRLHSTSSR